MPNWCFNHLTIIDTDKGEKPEEILARITNKNDKGERYFDFNTIIPMPEELNIVSGSETIKALRWFMFAHRQIITREEKEKVFDCIGSWEREQIREDTEETIQNLIDTHTDFEKPEKWKEFKDYGERIFNNIMKYDCPTWYEWCIKNWGTKWSSDSTRIDDSEDDIVIDFDTAWSPPIPVLVALSKKYPNNVFHFECEEESDMETAVCEFINGEIIE